MSAATATTALAAGVDTSGTVPDASGGAQRCIRRPGSTWTSCRCEACRPFRRRAQKLRAAGLLQVPDHEAAVMRLQSWLDRGFHASAIASAIGLTPQAAWQILYRQQRGADGFLSSTARRILAAGEPTAGRREATGTRRRLQALTWMGWSLDDLHEQSGVSVMSLSRVRSGGSPVVTVRTATAVSETYQRLQNTPGSAKQAAASARRLRWAPPAAWDDETIDYPQMEPVGIAGPRGKGQGPNTNDPVVIDEVRVLFVDGLTDREIGYRIGLSTSGVQALRSRHSIRRAA